MDIKIIEDAKDCLEIEMNDSILPSIIANNLVKKGVDAYFYDPHPLLPGFRLHIDSDKARDDLKDALEDIGKDLKEFNRLLKETY